MPATAKPNLATRGQKKQPRGRDSATSPIPIYSHLGAKMGGASPGSHSEPGSSVNPFVLSPRYFPQAESVIVELRGKSDGGEGLA